MRGLNEYGRIAKHQVSHPEPSYCTMVDVR
jgi:hypothetical protein